jgi:orotidine-5'-phosphate decarboxylase
LTSEPNADAVPERLELARRAGCDGVVCGAPEAAAAAALGLGPMVAGVRLADRPVNDQARVATPGDAIRAGARWLVIGRTVTAAPDRQAAARNVVADVDAAQAETTAPSRARGA